MRRGAQIKCLAESVRWVAPLERACGNAGEVGGVPGGRGWALVRRLTVIQGGVPVISRVAIVELSECCTGQIGGVPGIIGGANIRAVTHTVLGTVCICRIAIIAIPLLASHSDLIP